MARISFTDVLGHGADMRAATAFAGLPRFADAATLRFRDGDATITYAGAFDWTGGALTGTLDAATTRVDGRTTATATDIALDAAAFWSLATNGDAAGARRLLSSLADDVTGTRFADRLIGGAGGDTLRGLGGADLLFGGAGRDRLDGGAGSDRIYGGAGRDRLDGGSGADFLYGGAGADRLDGGSGPDRLFGGAGDDVLTGGPGGDVFFGGAGADVFVFAAPADFAAREAPDRIADFSRAEGDRIDLRAIDADMLDRGVQAFVFIGAAAFSGDPGELRFRDGVVSGDIHGDRRADFFIATDGVGRLSADDFIL